MEHQQYFKSDRMKEHEAFAKNSDTFKNHRVVSMAANIVDGHLIVGNRHWCPLMTTMVDLLGLDDKKHNNLTDQGFVDQFGIYMTRQEAWEVAKKAGQIKRVYQEGVLYSECYL